MLDYDERIGCIAIFLGSSPTCLNGADRDPRCLWYEHGKWKTRAGGGFWYVPWWKRSRARLVYCWLRLTHGRTGGREDG